MKPKIYTTDGRVTETFPANGEKFTLDELQHIVGGYIEIVRPKTFDIYDRLLIVNKEGLLARLPVNDMASAIAGQLIVGNALHVEPKFIN